MQTESRVAALYRAARIYRASDSGQTAVVVVAVPLNTAATVIGLYR